MTANKVLEIAELHARLDADHQIRRLIIPNAVHLLERKGHVVPPRRMADADFGQVAAGKDGQLVVRGAL